MSQSLNRYIIRSIKQQFWQYFEKKYKMKIKSCLQSQNDNQFQIELPYPALQLSKVFGQLKLYSKERLDGTQVTGQGIQSGQEIKGLKFISSKLAKLFHKNRKLPYNQISKILIDNFASQQNDQRNIKRRVYDAINVLVAAGVLVKKNNFVEMIKNKIKVKHENQKRDVIEDQLKQKQQRLQQKIYHHQRLLRKRKFIHKLFERNMKNEQKSLVLSKRSQRLDLKSIKNISQKSSNNRQKPFQQKQNNNSQSQSFKGKYHQKIIYNPKILIKVDNSLININKPFQNFITQFKTNNQLKIMIPYRKQELKKQIKWEHDNQMIEEKVQNKQYEIYQQGQKNDVNFFIQKDGPYSLIDLIQLLSLDGEFQEQ